MQQAIKVFKFSLFLILISTHAFGQAEKTALLNGESLQAPPLVSGGDEGPFTKEMMQPTDKIKLYVLFVDWPDAKATTHNFDSLWNLITGQGELFRSFENQGKSINLKIETHLNKQWTTLPQSTAIYFPPETASGAWNWEAYIKDCSSFFKHAFKSDTFTNNSIVVILPNPAIGDKWKEGVPAGNHPVNFHGLRSIITMSPARYTSKYTTLMHEIGHSYGSSELYPESGDWFDTEMMGLDIMGDNHLATGFLGYHRYRYGWMPFVPEKPRSIYLTEPHSYGVQLTPLSSDHGISMILIPDKNVPKDSLHAPAKLWGIEIAQDVQSPEQYFAGKNEKMLKEGEKIIIYTVEYPEQVGKRAIRLVPKKDFDKDKDRWSNVYLYQDGERFQNPAAPMDVMISRNDDGSFYLDVQVK